MRNSQPLFFRNAAQLLTLAGGPVPRRGVALRELGIVRDGGVLVGEGTIVRAGRTQDLRREASRLKAREIDCQGRVVMPGFVDCHTHLVFAGSRLGDFEQRISGKSYRAAAKAGGGILHSVRALRRASLCELFDQAAGFLREASHFGTTAMEVKSGYGLDVANELKALEVIRQLRKTSPVELVPTVLAAHVLPPKYRGRQDRYIDSVIHKLLPEVARRGLAEFIDCFCDRMAFSARHCRDVLEAGMRCGLTPRIHAEQTAWSGGAELAVSVAAASADHLDHVKPRDIEALARSDVTATLLPGANFHLNLGNYPPARALIEAGAAVALASDFNPGTCPTFNLQFIVSLASRALRMTPAEAIVAATLNAAYALRRGDRLGSIEAGKQADLIVMDVDDYRKIAYYFALNHCVMTVQHGRIVSLPLARRRGASAR